MPDRIDAIAALLREAGQAHHDAFIHVNGDDPDWPQWYADYLRESLGRLLGHDLDAESLAARLAALDQQQRQDAPDADWALFYARQLAAGEG